EWGVDWDRGVDRSGEIDGVAAVRREAWRYRDVRWNANRADTGGGGGGVFSCGGCVADRPDIGVWGGGEREFAGTWMTAAPIYSIRDISERTVMFSSSVCAPPSGTSSGRIAGPVP